MVNGSLQSSRYANGGCRRPGWLTRDARGLSAPVFQRKRQLFGQLDAIAPPALGLIKRGIGRRQQHFELRASGAASDADANGGIDWPVLDHDSGVRKRSAYAPGREPPLSQQTRKQARKSPPADPPREVADPQRVDHVGGEQFENLVARRVAEAIVNRLKMIDVEDQYRYGPTGSGFALDHARARLRKAATVEHACQRIH